MDGAPNTENYAIIYYPHATTCMSLFLLLLLLYDGSIMQVNMGAQAPKLQSINK